MSVVASVDPAMRHSRGLAGALLLGWAASLVLPALTIVFDTAARTLSGWQVLTSGYLAIAAGQFGWIANPAFAAALLGLSLPTGRWWLIGASLVLLATTLNTLDLALRPAFYRHRGFGAGYYLWFATNIAAATATLFFASKRHVSR